MGEKVKTEFGFHKHVFRLGSPIAAFTVTVEWTGVVDPDAAHELGKAITQAVDDYNIAVTRIHGLAVCEIITNDLLLLAEADAVEEKPVSDATPDTDDIPF